MTGDLRDLGALVAWLGSFVGPLQGNLPDALPAGARAVIDKYQMKIRCVVHDEAEIEVPAGTDLGVAMRELHAAFLAAGMRPLKGDGPEG